MTIIRNRKSIETFLYSTWCCERLANSSCSPPAPRNTASLDLAVAVPAHYHYMKELKIGSTMPTDSIIFMDFCLISSNYFLLNLEVIMALKDSLLRFPVPGRVQLNNQLMSWVPKNIKAFQTKKILLTGIFLWLYSTDLKEDPQSQKNIHRELSLKWHIKNLITAWNNYV